MCSTSSRSPSPTSPRSRSGAPTARSIPPRSHGLPPFLAHEVGVDSGLMIAQYAAAGIVSELKRLAVPASVDSIPSSRDAGGPRVDGLGGRPQAAPRRSTGSPACSRSRCSPAPARSTCGRRCSRARRPAPCATSSAPSPRGPGHDHFLSPDIEAVTELVHLRPGRARRRRSSLMTTTDASTGSATATRDRAAPRAATSAPRRAGAPRPPSACS